MNINNIEQSGVVLAEEILPKHELELQNEYGFETKSEQSGELKNTCSLLYLDENSINLRCFYTTASKTFLGMLLSETQDSFLVSGAASLVMDKDGYIYPDPVSSEHEIRFLKSSISHLTFAQPKSTFHYFKFLMDNGPKHVDKSILEKHKSYIHEYVEKYSFENNLEFTPGFKPKFKRFEVDGASEFSFNPFTKSEKIH